MRNPCAIRFHLCVCVFLVWEMTFYGNPSMLKLIIVENTPVMLRRDRKVFSQLCEPKSHGEKYLSFKGSALAASSFLFFVALRDQSTRLIDVAPPLVPKEGLTEKPESKELILLR
uniref:Uncharacterized protein n=1 Tax=Amphimedon queenslandica TaxID=400682 RepID=A0A1X7U1V6_AMPQE